jgi:hypothetical protein
VLLGVGSAAVGATVANALSLVAVLVGVAVTRTRAECPVDVVVVVVVVGEAVASASTAAATGTLLDAVADALRELTFPPDEAVVLWRAECAVAFFAVVESVLLDAVELLAELLADALPAPEPAPVSA